jgi:type II secretory pathway pseudopilin PulG
MIEIVISLAVIGFALVAIIGILPTGMSVQRDNRQETIIKQDAEVMMDVIRNAQVGLDDLTNYVIAITNTITQFNGKGQPQGSFTFWYTPTSSSGTPAYPLNSGARIVGLLSTPKIVMTGSSSFYSNHVVAIMRSLSGPASEKYPQTNAAVQDLALSYRLIPDITPCDLGTGGLVSRNIQTNLHELRLIFRWPLLPNGDAGPSRQVFRTMVSGSLLQTNEPGFPPPAQPGPAPTRLYFFQPRTFVRAQ